MQRLYFSRLPNRHMHHHLATTRLAPGEGTFDHRHDFPEIFFVSRGTGIHRWNGRELPLVRGCVTWIAPADAHSFFGGMKEGIEFINLAFAPRWWANFAKLFRAKLSPGSPVAGRPGWHCVLSEMETAGLERAMGAWLAADPGDPHWLVQMTGMLMRFLVAPPVNERRVTPPEWLVKWRADLAVPKLIPEPLAAWQKRSGRTPEHLARSCRRFYGTSPTEMISRARIALAQTTLRRGDKIATVALDVGFQNLGYFYRTFRRVVGVSPGVWLNAQMTDSAVPR